MDETDYTADANQELVGFDDADDDALDVTGDDQEVARSNYEFGGYDVGEIINPTTDPNNEAYGWRYYTNGTAVSPEGEVYASDATGTPFSLKSFLGGAYDKIVGAFTTGGATDWGKVAALGYGAYQALNPPAQQKAGYQGGIPDLVMNRQQVAYTDPERRPGSGGRQYFTDPIYTEGKPAKMTAEQAKAAGAAQAAGILSAYKGAGSSLPEKGTVPTKQTATDKPTRIVDTGMGTTPTAAESAAAFADFGKLHAPDTTGATQEPDPSKLGPDGRSIEEWRRQDPTFDRPWVPPAGYTPSTDGLAGLFGRIAPAKQDVPTQSTGNPQESLVDPMESGSPAPQALLDLVGSKTFAKGGAPGRYLRGDTDGMADKLEASIDGEQPAALSHGEFVIPADVVSHIGNGNSDAGVKKLYQMMSAVRKARTGTEKQGKRINPDKFLPGGDVKKFQVGGTVPTVAGMPTVGTESSLSNWAGPYVTDMLAKGKALADAPYQAYTGPLTAGASQLQTQAMQGLAGLSVPTSIGAGAATAGQVAQKAGGMSYTPTSFTSGYTPPAAYQTGTFDNQFQAPDAYQTGAFQSQFQAPDAYQTGQFTTGEFDTSAAQRYINPYVQTALNPQLEEMKRQSDIARLSDASRLTKAGAYGGSRQAIMESEGRRNLLGKQTEAIGAGYSTAFDRAMAQFNQDQARQMQVQQAGEASRQFGAGQALNAAQMQAQFGMQAQQAGEASRQFGAGQAMTGAQSRAQYGLAGQQAGEQSRQYGYGQSMAQAQAQQQAEMQRQQAAEQSRQYGSQFGLNALQQQLSAAQAQSAMGQQEQGAGLALLAAQMGAGGTQRAIETEGIAADKAQFEEQRDDPINKLLFQQSLLRGLPLEAQTSLVQQPSTLNRLTGGVSSMAELINALYPGTVTTTPAPTNPTTTTPTTTTT